MLIEQMERVERGEEPMAVIRDRGENEPMIDLRRERRGWQGFQVQYKNIFQREAEAVDADSASS
jgi:hypothetical protein